MYLFNKNKTSNLILRFPQFIHRRMLIFSNKKILFSEKKFKKNIFEKNAITILKSGGLRGSIFQAMVLPLPTVMFSEVFISIT